MALRRQSPFGSRSKRASSSPPSPVLDRPPMRFIAIASVSCASLLMDPNDIAPVAKRFTISLAGSTSSIGTGFVGELQLHQPAQRAQLAVLVVDQLRVFLERREARLPDRVLQLADRHADSTDDIRRARDTDSCRRCPVRSRIPTRVGTRGRASSGLRAPEHPGRRLRCATPCR